MFNITSIIISNEECDVFDEMDLFVPSNITVPLGSYFPYVYGCLGDIKIIFNPFINCWYSPPIILKNEAVYLNLVTRGRNHLVIKRATNNFQLKQAIDLQELIK